MLLFKILIKSIVDPEKYGIPINDIIFHGEIIQIGNIIYVITTQIPKGRRIFHIKRRNTVVEYQQIGEGLVGGIVINVTELILPIVSPDYVLPVVCLQINSRA